MKLTVLACTLVLTVATAHAEPKRASVAVGLAAVGELASISVLALGGDRPVVAVAGLVGVATAPSFGHWYAGNLLTRGMVVRGAGAAVTAVGILDLANADRGGNIFRGTLVSGLGITTVVVGTIDDLLTTPSEVRRRNQLDVRIVPTATPGSAGLGIAGTF